MPSGKDSKETKSRPQAQQAVEQKPGITWGPGAAILITLLLYIGAQLIGELLLSIYPRLKGWPYAQRVDWLTNSIIGQFWFVLIAEALTVGGLVWYIRRRHGSVQALGFGKLKQGQLAKNIGYVIAGFLTYAAILYAVILGVVQPFIPQIDLSQQQDVGFSSPANHLQLVMAFISLVILPPLVEETVFRGFLFSGLKKRLPVVKAALVTSLLFAAPHLLEGNNGQLLWEAGIDTFILSMVLVYVRVKTEHVYAGMAIHALKNSVAFVAIYHASIFIR